MRKMQCVSRKIIDIAAIACVGLLLVVLLALFLGGFDFYEAAGFVYSYAGKAERIFLCIVSAAAFGLLYVTLGRILGVCGVRTQKLLVGMASLTALALQAYFLFYVRSCYKWDSGFVIGGASSLVQNGTIAQQAYYYLSVYPNQNTFVCITALLVKLSNLLGISVEGRTIVWNLFNTVCMDISVVLAMYFIKKKISSSYEWQMTQIYLMFLCNPFLYIGVSYYYTITLSLPLTMGFLLLVTEKSKERNRAVFKWILAGILLGIGYELRATAVIFAIAAVIAGIRRGIDGKACRWRRAFAKFAVIMVTTVLVIAGLGSVQRKYIGIDTTDTAFPVTHWLMMSLSGEGAHNAEDESYTASFATKEEKEIAVKQRLFEKINAMSFSDYMHLVRKKVQNTFGNGMNGYTLFLADALRTDGVYEYIFGGHKDIAVLWHQGYYLFIMFGMICYAGMWLGNKVRVFKSDNSEDYDGFMLLLTMLGAIIFYILWEASEQYSVPFMMVMNVLGLWGLSAISVCASEENVLVNKIICGIAFVTAGLVLMWGIMHFLKFTKEVSPYSYKAAVQILANTPMEVDDGQTLCQTIQIKRPFNRLIIQWRNPDMEESSAKYRVELREYNAERHGKEACGDLIYTADIDAAGTGYNGAGIYDFPTVVPRSDYYAIIIYKVSGDAEHDLEFVVYDMPGYTPYGLGQLSMRTDSGSSEHLQSVQELTASLLFSVSEEKSEPYATVPQYIFMIVLLCLVFLFMGICCKLIRVPVRRTKQYSERENKI